MFPVGGLSCGIAKFVLLVCGSDSADLKMAPIPERALVALKAMKAIGFPMHVAKPVLKNLLKVYDNNWEYIEAENYRVLADAILDAQESKVHILLPA